MLAETLKQLCGDSRFMDFMGEVRELREYAIRAAVAEQTVENTGRTVAALGEIRAYEDILNLVAEYRPQ